MPVAAMAPVSPTAVIAEDEPPLRAQLSDMLAAVWPPRDIVAAVEDGFQALGALKTHHPDVLFLDIQMPGASGLDVARAASGRQHVVFITACDQYAVAAFEHGAVDSLMKPIGLERLSTACERLKARLPSAPARLEGILDVLARQAVRARPFLRWINASAGTEVRLITVEQVCCFQADTKYTRVVTAEDELLIRKPLKELVDELDPEIFWQIHRSTLLDAARRCST